MTSPEPPAQAPGSSEHSVEKTRAWTGLAAVVAGDVAIALAAILGIVYASKGASAATAQIVAILSSGFTAIGTMTTAYFGIKSMSNTASSLAKSTGRPAGAPDTTAATPVPDPAAATGSALALPGRVDGHPVKVGVACP
jgi:hypothetical protein